MEWLENASYWHWWVIAVVLVILEVFSPGAFFLWLGISAGITGLIMLAVPDLSWQYQLLLFSVFSVASIMIWHLFLKHHPTESDHPVLNRRGEQYIDRVFTLDEPVVNGLGKIRVDDSTWKISGEDCDAGSRVRVVGVDGVVLKIVVVI
ncbi:MAG: NfeD family protein [Candidatus Sedimenticola sp. PURPLELP]